MSKRSDPAAFARAAGAPDPANLADPVPAPVAGTRASETLAPLPESAPPSAGALTVPGPAAAPLPAQIPDEETSLTPYIDAHGFDPAEYLSLIHI